VIASVWRQEVLVASKKLILISYQCGWAEQRLPKLHFPFQLLCFRSAKCIDAVLSYHRSFHAADLGEILCLFVGRILSPYSVRRDGTDGPQLRGIETVIRRCFAMGIRCVLAVSVVCAYVLHELRVISRCRTTPHLEHNVLEHFNNFIISTI